VTYKRVDVVELGKQVLQQEASAVRQLADMLDASFEKAVLAIFNKCKGQLIITGLGKSGLVARKIAGTLTSTGTPAVFIHPVEGMHGDLGIITAKDMLLALSKSGNSAEVIKFVQGFKRLGGAVIAVTDAAESQLAKLSDFVLLLPSVQEAGPLQLAPTTSTTLTMALGDALAMALLKLRGFSEKDFAQFHPDGSLGKRLLLRAEDLMHSGRQLPKVTQDTSMQQVILEMTSKALGMTCVTDRAGRFVGTITDGDLRRLIERTDNLLGLNAQQAMILSRRSRGPKGPFTVRCEELAVNCRDIMKKNQVTSVVVVDSDHRPLGIVRLQDITAAGLA